MKKAYHEEKKPKYVSTWDLSKFFFDFLQVLLFSPANKGIIWPYVRPPLSLCFTIGWNLIECEILVLLNTDKENFTTVMMLWFPWDHYGYIFQRNQNINPLVKVSLVLKASLKQIKLFKIGGKIQAASYNGAPIDKTSHSFLRKYILSNKIMLLDDKWFRPIVRLHLAKFDHSLTCQNLILAFLHNNVHYEHLRGRP